MPLRVSSTCAHHQEVKIALHSLWYHHTYTCDDTRGCVMQFWPPDDEHMCSKHVEAWNKLIIKQKCCALSWLITDMYINIYIYIYIYIYWDVRSAKRQNHQNNFNSLPFVFPPQVVLRSDILCFLSSRSIFYANKITVYWLISCLRIASRLLCSR